MPVEVSIPNTSSRKIARSLCTLLEIPKDHQERNIIKFDDLYPEKYCVWCPGNNEWLKPDIAIRRKAFFIPSSNRNHLGDWKFTNTYQIIIGNGRDDLSKEILEELKEKQKRILTTRVRKAADEVKFIPKRLAMSLRIF